MGLFYSSLSRDWTKAIELVGSMSNEELRFGGGPFVPRECLEIPIAKYQGKGPETKVEFVAARDKLMKKVTTHPDNPSFLSVLACIDAYLGRKQEAIQEARRAVEILPVSKDAYGGATLVTGLAIVYAWTNEPDLAFQSLGVAINLPAGNINYGELKLDPDWDPLRKDPRFDKLLAQLAPKD